MYSVFLFHAALTIVRFNYRTLAFASLKHRTQLSEALVAMRLLRPLCADCERTLHCLCRCTLDKKCQILFKRVFSWGQQILGNKFLNLSDFLIETAEAAMCGLREDAALFVPVHTGRKILKFVCNNQKRSLSRVNLSFFFFCSHLA